MKKDFKYNLDDLQDRDFVVEHQNDIHYLDLMVNDYTMATKRGIRMKSKEEIELEILYNYRNIVGEKFESSLNIKIAIKMLAESFIDGKTGVVLLGVAGNGKTSLLRAFKKFYKDNSSHPFSYFPLRMIKYLSDGEYCYKNGMLNPRAWYIMIDDFGSEPKRIVHFGTEITPFTDLIMDHYDDNRIIWATTNLRKEAITSRYGDRVTRRLGEMCVFCEL